MNVLGLFSGIGGFELGFQRAGFNIAAMCEIEPYARAVLAKRFPGVPIYGDIRGVTAAQLAQDGIEVDVVTGGFPCQDISLAGKGAGLTGERSGLWFEMHRVIAEVRPSWVVVENVSALRSRGLDAVLRSLAEIGYDAEWHCIPAAAVGAPHRRDRVWIVAHPQADAPRPDADSVRPYRAPLHQHGSPELRDEQVGDAGPLGKAVAHPHHQGLEIRLEGAPGQQPAAVGGGWWQSEPDVGRVAHGVPNRVDRLRALGNAVVPQIPEAIARAIRRFEVFG